MFVSNVRGQFIRGSSPAKFVRNGDYIDVHFTEDGVKKWVAIKRDDVKFMLDLSEHGNYFEGRVDLDVPANLKTAIRQLANSDIFRDEIGEVL